MRVYMSFPYFRFVFSTKTASQHLVEVKYDVFGRRLEIIAQSAIGIPVYQNAPEAP